MTLLNDDLLFPPVSMADEDGILAMGGNLSTERLLLAYRNVFSPGTMMVNRFYGGAPTHALCYFPKN